MSEMSNEPLEQDEQNTPVDGATRPMPQTSPSPQAQASPRTPPPRQPRRPIAADDVPPTAYTRPPLSRRQETQPLPPQRAQPQQPKQQARERGPVPPGAFPETPPRTRGERRRERQQVRRERAPGLPPDKASSGLYLPWWSLLLMVAFVGCMALGALAFVGSLESNSPPGGGTPLIVVVTSTFTVGPPATLTPIPIQATLTATLPLPTIPPTLTLPPGNFQLGDTVQVVGVGESGLNLRSAPGTDSTVKFRASEGDSFILKDGPQEASGEQWWMIQDSVDTTRSGWAARRFLTIITPTSAPAIQIGVTGTLAPQ